MDRVGLAYRRRDNWIKMYDKKGSVLRVETVINQTRDMKEYRTKEGDDEGEPSWRPLALRRGVGERGRQPIVGGVDARGVPAGVEAGKSGTTLYQVAVAKAVDRELAKPPGHAEH